MTDETKVNEAIRRGSFKWQKPRQQPEFKYKKK